MICSYCPKEATIHLTEIIDGELQEVHLCEDCSNEKGADFKTYFGSHKVKEALNLESIFGVTQKLESIKCNSCGMTSKAFSETGRLGCPDCYKAFATMLLPLIKRVHRSTHHVGKKPKNISKKDQFVYDLRVLQDLLRKSIESEAFEEAAKIRDQIKKLEVKKKKKKTDA